MIRTVRVNKIPEEVVSLFAEQAKKEWHQLRRYRSYFYLNNRAIWIVYANETPVCVIAIKRSTLIGSGGEVSFLLCRGFSRHGKKTLDFIRRAVRRLTRIYYRVYAQVEEGFWIGEKFVTFFGFRKTASKYEFEETTYNVFEMRASWLQ